MDCVHQSHAISGGMQPLSSDVQEEIRSGISITSAAHCLRELVRNALDADASCVAARVNLPRMEVQVVDNGCGMTDTQLRDVGCRYATSRGDGGGRPSSRQFGYRGEALASLARVSRQVELTSRPRGADVTWRRQLISDVKCVAVTQASRPRPGAGTTVTVRGLLHARGACRRAVELNSVCRIVEMLALPYPRVSFSLRDDATGTLLLEVPRCDSLMERYRGLMSAEEGELEIRTVSSRIGSVRLRGLLTNDGRQYVFVNKRTLPGGRLHRHVARLLDIQLSSGGDITSRPGFSLFFKVPGDQCVVSYDADDDRVQFADPERVLALVERALFTALGKTSAYGNGGKGVEGPSATNSRANTALEAASSDQQATEQPHGVPLPAGGCFIDMAESRRGKKVARPKVPEAGAPETPIVERIPAALRRGLGNDCSVSEAETVLGGFCVTKLRRKRTRSDRREERRPQVVSARPSMPECNTRRKAGSIGNSYERVVSDKSGRHMSRDVPSKNRSSSCQAGVEEPVTARTPDRTGGMHERRVNEIQQPSNDWSVTTGNQLNENTSSKNVSVPSNPITAAPPYRSSLDSLREASRESSPRPAPSTASEPRDVFRTPPGYVTRRRAFPPPLKRPRLDSDSPEEDTAPVGVDDGVVVRKIAARRPLAELFGVSHSLPAGEKGCNGGVDTLPEVQHVSRNGQAGCGIPEGPAVDELRKAESCDEGSRNDTAGVVCLSSRGYNGHIQVAGKHDDANQADFQNAPAEPWSAHGNGDGYRYNSTTRVVLSYEQHSPDLSSFKLAPVSFGSTDNSSHARERIGMRTGSAPEYNHERDVSDTTHSSRAAHDGNLVQHSNPVGCQQCYDGGMHIPGGSLSDDRVNVTSRESRSSCGWSYAPASKDINRHVVALRSSDEHAFTFVVPRPPEIDSSLCLQVPAPHLRDRGQRLYESLHDRVKECGRSLTRSLEQERHGASDDKSYVTCYQVCYRDVVDSSDSLHTRLYELPASTGGFTSCASDVDIRHPAHTNESFRIKPVLDPSSQCSEPRELNGSFTGHSAPFHSGHNPVEGTDHIGHGQLALRMVRSDAGPFDDSFALVPVSASNIGLYNGRSACSDGSMTATTAVVQEVRVTDQSFALIPVFHGTQVCTPTTDLPATDTGRSEPATQPDHATSGVVNDLLPSSGDAARSDPNVQPASVGCLTTDQSLFITTRVKDGDPTSSEKAYLRLVPVLSKSSISEIRSFCNRDDTPILRAPGVIGLAALCLPKPTQPFSIAHDDVLTNSGTEVGSKKGQMIGESGCHIGCRSFAEADQNNDEIGGNHEVCEENESDDPSCEQSDPEMFRWKDAEPCVEVDDDVDEVRVARMRDQCSTKTSSVSTTPAFIRDGFCLSPHWSESPHSQVCIPRLRNRKCIRLSQDLFLRVSPFTRTSTPYALHAEVIPDRSVDEERSENMASVGSAGQVTRPPSAHVECNVDEHGANQKKSSDPHLPTDDSTAIDAVSVDSGPAVNDIRNVKNGDVSQRDDFSGTGSGHQVDAQTEALADDESSNHEENERPKVAASQTCSNLTKGTFSGGSYSEGIMCAQYSGSLPDGSMNHHATITSKLPESLQDLAEKTGGVDEKRRNEETPEESSKGGSHGTRRGKSDHFYTAKERLRCSEPSEGDEERTQGMTEELSSRTTCDVDVVIPTACISVNEHKTEVRDELDCAPTCDSKEFVPHDGIKAAQPRNDNSNGTDPLDATKSIPCGQRVPSTETSVDGDVTGSHWAEKYIVDLGHVNNSTNCSRCDNAVQMHNVSASDVDKEASCSRQNVSPGKDQICMPNVGAVCLDGSITTTDESLPPGQGQVATPVKTPSRNMEGDHLPLADEDASLMVTPVHSRLAGISPRPAVVEQAVSRLKALASAVEGGAGEESNSATSLLGQVLAVCETHSIPALHPDRVSEHGNDERDSHVGIPATGVTTATTAASVFESSASLLSSSKHLPSAICNNGALSTRPPPPQPPPPPLPPVLQPPAWQRVTDPTGRRLFVNSLTGHTSLQTPPALSRRQDSARPASQQRPVRPMVVQMTEEPHWRFPAAQRRVMLTHGFSPFLPRGRLRLPQASEQLLKQLPQLVSAAHQLPSIPAVESRDGAHAEKDGATELLGSHAVGEAPEELAEGELRREKCPCRPDGKRRSGLDVVSAQSMAVSSTTTSHCSTVGLRAHACSVTSSLLRQSRVLRQLDGKFIALVAGDVVLLLDQHAASERIRLETLLEEAREGGDGGIKPERVAPVLEVMLPKGEVLLLKEHQNAARRIGFILDDTGDDLPWMSDSSAARQAVKVALRAVPACLLSRGDRAWTAERAAYILRQLTNQLTTNRGAAAALPAALIDVYNSMACHSAVRFGDTLARDECVNLLSALVECRLPLQCAHGRPSVAPLVDISRLPPPFQADRPDLTKLRRRLSENTHPVSAARAIK